MNKSYEISFNRSKKIYTIRVYVANKRVCDKGRLIAKYRSNPQGKDYHEDWTENDIRNFLKTSNDYYEIK